MGGFSELIKNFDKTRDYVLDFFIYGCKVRSDFDRKSARTYDDEKRRVESWLGDYLRSETTDRGKQVSISVDSSRVPENPLFRAFASRSFTDNDIRLHFLLLDLLSDGKAHSIRSLTEALASEYGAVFEEQTVRGKLREYAAEGILSAEKQGKSVLYRLLPDTPENLFARFPGLADAVCFFSGVPEFGFIGHSLVKAAGLRNESFLMKHQYIVHILEDEVLLELLELIRRQHAARLCYSSRREKKEEITGIPLKIYISAQTGRRYLIFYHPGMRRISSCRLDHLRRVYDGGECPDYAHYVQILERNADKCFGVSFENNTARSRETTIRIVMEIDLSREPYILERLQREKRCGSVERLDERHFMLTLTVFDPNEIMSWLKTYIGRIVSIEGAPQELRRFQEDIRRMYRMYCRRPGKQDTDAAVF